MERHAFVARLNGEQREAYVAAHRNVPPELLARYRQAGIRSLSIFLHEGLLFLYLESDDFAAAVTALENDPIEREWQKLTSPMLGAGGYVDCLHLFHMD
jgi:L-rhamnose mutarotase